MKEFKIRKVIVFLAWGISLMLLLWWYPLRNEIMAFWLVVFSMSISTTLPLVLLKNFHLALPGILVLPFFCLNVMIAAMNGKVNGKLAEQIVFGYLFFLFINVCGTLLAWLYKDEKKKATAK